MKDERRRCDDTRCRGFRELYGGYGENGGTGRTHLRQGYGGHAIAEDKAWREISGRRALPIRLMLSIWLMVRGGGAMTRNHKAARCAMKPDSRNCYYLLFPLSSFLSHLSCRFFTLERRSRIYPRKPLYRRNESHRRRIPDGSPGSRRSSGRRASAAR